MGSLVGERPLTLGDAHGIGEGPAAGHEDRRAPGLPRDG